MPLTSEEGKAYAAKYLAGLDAGFARNNHAETLDGLFADELAWDWSDGTRGEGGLDEILAVISGTWGMMADSMLAIDPLVVVDTDHSVVSILGSFVMNITGGLDGETNLVRDETQFILHLNEDGKCVRWLAIWDNNDPALNAALGAVMSKLAADPPPETVPPMPISVEEGKEFAGRVMAGFAAGFAENNHLETTAGLFADRLSWDWSDATKGEGSLEEVMGIMAKTWGFMCDSFVFPRPVVAVDTDHSVISVGGPLVGNITGGFADENNPFSNDIHFVFHLNEDRKCVRWVGLWDNRNPQMLAALGRVMARLEPAESTAAVPPPQRPRMLQSPPLRSQGRLPLPVRPPRVALPLGRLGARDAAAPARLARWAAGGPGSMAQFQAPKGARTYILSFGTAHPLPLAPRSEWRIPSHAGVCSSDWSGRELVVSR